MTFYAITDTKQGRTGIVPLIFKLPQNLTFTLVDYDSNGRGSELRCC